MMKRAINKCGKRLRLMALMTLCGMSGACSTLGGGGKSQLSGDADALLRKMSDTLATAEKFTYRATRKIDPSLVPGGKVRTRARISGAVHRPDRLLGVSVTGNTTRRFIYDGENVTLHDVEMDLYATVVGERTIDRTIDKIAERWDFNPPMADLLVANPYRSLTRHVTGGEVLAGGSVGGVRCKRIAAVGEEVDWDLWVAEKDNLPRKFVITYKRAPGAPKTEVRISEWNLNPTLDAAQFVFTPSADAQEIEVAPAKL